MYKGGIVLSDSFEFLGLEEFIANPNITDINYNGRDLWCDHLEKGRLVYSRYLTPEHFLMLCSRFANYVNRQFNALNPVLEADYGLLRVSMLHPHISSNLSLSIRKVSEVSRMNEQKIIEDKYISKQGLKFLKYAIESRLNIMISGLPGCGKTELLKFLTNYIDEKERVITIEDNYEINYGLLHPHKDSVSLRVDERFGYDDAIKCCLRQKPNWILVSETRGEEVVEMLRSVATGSHLISTIHARSAHEIPKRMALMMPQTFHNNSSIYEQVIEHIDVGIHIDLKVDEEAGIFRYIREIVAYTNDEVEELYHFKNKRSIKTIPKEFKERGKLYDKTW